MKRKRIIAVIAAICMAVTSGCAGSDTAAGSEADSQTEITEETEEAEETAEDTELEDSEEENDLGMINSIPDVGDTIGEFTVTDTQPFDILGGTLVTLTHEKTGGLVTWIANNDTERSFVIGFRTHYDTDKGVPHVFEHAALSGSEKYPDSGMFFSMMSQTYQTYLNAFTDVCWTDYEAASLSEEQLLKYTDYLLAGVFEPLVVSDKHAMMREAYRYELDDADSDINLTGTVYSEMQGAYYANAQYYSLVKNAYPGSYYSTCTGGKPGVIEEMTQQDLIDFHDTYYQPGNAISILYGDMDISRFLDLIASYYDNYSKTDVSTADDGYEPFTGYSRVDCDIPVSSDESEDTSLVYIMPLRGYDDTDVYMLEQFLGEAFTNQSSAMYRLMLEKFPNSTFGAGVLNKAECMMCFELDYAEGVTPEDFKEAVDEGINEVLSEGIKTDALNSVLKTKKKELLSVREEHTIGTTYAEELLTAYAMLGDPAAYIRHVDTLTNDGEEWLESGVLESAITDQLVDPQDSRLMVMTKKPGMLDEINEENAEKLVQMKADMTSDEIQALVDETEDYNKWVDEAGANSQIDEIKAVGVSDLAEEVQTFEATDETEDGIRFVTSDTGDDRLVETVLNFDASAIPADKLTAYAGMTYLLGKLPTSQHTYDEVSRKMDEYGISFACEKFNSDDDYDTYSPVFRIKINCLEEDLDDAIATAWEVFTDTQFDNTDLISYFCTSQANQFKTYYNTAEQHHLADAYAWASIFKADRYIFETQYTPFEKYLESVGKMDSDGIKAETAAWEEMLNMIQNRHGLSISVISGTDEIAKTKSAVTAYVSQLPDSEQEAADYSSLELLPDSYAVVVAGSANYNVKAVSTADTGVEYTGSLDAVAQLISDKVLIPVMRYRNGVYSPHCSIGRAGTYILAYRDPSISTTVDTVLPSLGDTLKNTDITQDELDNYIISAYSYLALPDGPVTGAETAVNDVLCGNTTYADKLEKMKSLKALTPDEVKEDAVIFDKLSDEGSLVTVGSQNSISEEKDRFDVIETWFVTK